jgi:hypothetical protein
VLGILLIKYFQNLKYIISDISPLLGGFSLMILDVSLVMVMLIGIALLLRTAQVLLVGFWTGAG